MLCQFEKTWSGAPCSPQDRFRKPTENITCWKFGALRMRVKPNFEFLRWANSSGSRNSLPWLAASEQRFHILRDKVRMATLFWDCLWYPLKVSTSLSNFFSPNVAVASCIISKIALVLVSKWPSIDEELEENRRERLTLGNRGLISGLGTAVKVSNVPSCLSLKNMGFHQNRSCLVLAYGKTLGCLSTTLQQADGEGTYTEPISVELTFTVTHYTESA